MASNPTTAIRTGLVPYRVTVRQFRAMIDANVFPEGARVELLGGILVEMTTNNAHDYLVGHLANILRLMMPAGWCLREEKSVQVGRYWRPQPDISILRGRDVNYARRGPQSADIAMLAEVADSSYVKDSVLKLSRYAAVGVPIYWIVNVEKSQVEVHREPQGRGRLASYQKVEIYKAPADVPVVIDGQDRGRIAVKDMLLP